MEKYKDLIGELVTVTLRYGDETHRVYGRLVRPRMLSVTVAEERGSTQVYQASPEEAAKDSTLSPAEPWVRVTSETGGDLSAPPGSRGAWGAQNPSAAFKLRNGDWNLSYGNLDFREAAATVSVEPIDAEGLRWIEANLTAYQRETLFVALLEEEAPQLVDEFYRVVQAVRDYATAEERRREY